MMMKRMGIALLFLAGLSAPVLAQSLPQQLSRCLAITGTLQRLACYDAVAHGAGLSAPAPAYAPPPAPTYAPAYTPTPAYAPPPVTASATPQNAFGADRLPRTAPPPHQVNRIVADIVHFDLDIRGRFTLTLSNGQVWRQIEGDDSRTKPRPGARSVTIEHAVLGSYALTFNDSNRLYKVTRVQ